MKNKKNNLDTIANDIITRLNGKVIIHRYDSYSTNSIYLKFDYGVANSLRISDHDGKQHLQYRYNILESLSDKSSKKERFRHGMQMIFYSPAMVKACCRDILAAKAEKEKHYHDYEAVVRAAKSKITAQKGFWAEARLISEVEYDGIQTHQSE